MLRVTSLVFVKGNSNVKILQEGLLDSAIGQSYILFALQQDNARPHTSVFTERRFTDSNVDFPTAS